MRIDYYCYQDDIYDVVADAKLLKQTDKVTGKQKIIPRQKRTLFIPGRVIYITRMKPIKKYTAVTHNTRCIIVTGKLIFIDALDYIK